MANEFAHLELSTGNVAAARKFYQGVFDWKFSDLPDMSYTMINAGKGPGGGMQKVQMDGQPTAWTPYVQVVDVKKTLDKAISLGASVVVPYQEIGEMGAIGIFIDPTGAALGVWAASKKVAPKAAKKKSAPKKKAAAKKKPAAKKKKK